MMYRPMLPDEWLRSVLLIMMSVYCVGEGY
jgi:hypothetical protein